MFILVRVFRALRLDSEVAKSVVGKVPVVFLIRVLLNLDVPVLIDTVIIGAGIPVGISGEVDVCQLVPFIILYRSHVRIH